MTEIRIRRLTAAGTLLYGDRWQRPLSRATGISQTAISQMLSGDRTVTDDVQRKLATALSAEAGRLRSSADKIDKLRTAVEKEIGD